MSKLKLATMLTALISITFYSPAKAVESKLVALKTIRLENQNLNKPKFLMQAERNEIKANLEEPRVSIKQKNLSKKFGPLKLRFRVRSRRNASLRFNLDLVESMHILTDSKSIQDFVTAMGPDQKHFIVSPDLRKEIYKLSNSLKACWLN